MDYYIYNLFGYKTNTYINNSAIKIQKCYRNFKSYQIQKKLNIIHRRYVNTISDNIIDYENNQEQIYWDDMRKNIKNNINHTWVFI